MIKYFFFFITTTSLLLIPIITHVQTYTPSNRTPQADNSQIGTQVKNLGGGNFGIEGGLQRGQNLFYSFTDFSVPTGGQGERTKMDILRSTKTRTANSIVSID